ncbi:MAG TPA: GntR family transcriptional regulator [Acidimicrobiales bacterium]
MRSVRYREIADDLRRRIGSGEFGAGRLLPSESELSRAYGVSRVTARKALETVRDEGLIDSRQGFGWFVATDPLRQNLGRLGTIEAQLAASGVVPERRVLEFAFVDATPEVGRILSCERVLEVVRLNLADGHPFARVTVWCPEELGDELSRADVEGSPFYELLDVELGGATQTIGAVAAAPNMATLLEVPTGSPLLRCERTTTTVFGEAVLHSEHLFPAHLTEFVVALPHAERSIAPSGLRLLDIEG